MRPSNEFCIAFLKASGWLDNHDAEIKSEAIDECKGILGKSLLKDCESCKTHKTSQMHAEAQHTLNWLDSTFIGSLKDKVVLTKALEKQIPKKMKDDGYHHITCDCEHRIDMCMRHEISYCPYCGQAIKWE